MKAFITGSTGLLGTNLVQLLLKLGHEVTALARSPQKAAQVLDPRCRVFSGDLCATDRIAPGLRGCDVLFHCAAFFRDYAGGADREVLRRTNVEATARLLEAAHAADLHNVVFVSSNGVTATPADGSAQTERSGYAEDTDNDYFRSKLEAEKAVDAFLARHPEMRVVVIRPAMMVGPGDGGPTPAGRNVLQFLARRLPAILPIRMVVVDARDVATAMISAATRGEPGERFIVGGRGCTMEEFLRTLEEVSGVPAPTRRPPFGVARAMLGLACALSPITGRAPPLRPRDLVRLRHLTAPDSSKAEQVLGVRFRELAVTLRDTVEWFRAHPPASGTMG